MLKRTLLFFRRQLLLPLGMLSGLLYGLAFLFGAYILVVPFIAYCAFMILKSKKHALLFVWLGGLTAMLATTHWMTKVNGSVWSGTTDINIQPFINVIWLLSGLWWSLGFLLLPVVYKAFMRPLKKQHSYLMRAIIFSFAWAFCEWLRAFIFSVINYENSASLGPHWLFGASGLALADTPVAYAARLVGLFGLSFIVCCFVLLVPTLTKKHYKTMTIYVSFILLLVVGGWLVGRPSYSLPRSITVVHNPFVTQGSLLQDSLEPNSEWQLSSKPHIVILPEYSGVFDKGLSAKDASLVRYATNNQPVQFIDVRTYYDEDARHLNRMGLFDAQGTELVTRDKNFLIPAGEYIPYYTQAILRAFGAEKVITAAEPRHIQKSGINPLPIEAENMSLGALACSGAITPELYRNLAAQGADILINSASLGIFKNADSYYLQSLQFGRFNAIANNRPFVQASKEGPSYALTKDADLIYRKDAQDPMDVHALELKSSTRKMPYSVAGEWLLYVACAWLLYSVSQPIVKKLRKHA